MSTIHQIRQSIQHKVDHWEALAESLELQLTLGRADALQRFDAERQRLQASIETLKERIGPTLQQGEAASARLKAALEHLEVKLALGRAETREVYLEQRNHLEQAIQSFEARLDEAVATSGERLESELKAFARQADRLRAEMEALEFQFQINTESARQHMVDARTALLLKIEAFRKQVSAQRGSTQDRLQQAEGELAEAARHLKASFLSLFKLK